MSLTACIKKADKSLRQEDKAAILSAARKYRHDGLSADDAGIKAVEDQITIVSAMEKSALAGLEMDASALKPTEQAPAVESIQTVTVHQEPGKHSPAQNDDFVAAGAQAKTLPQGKYVAVEIKRNGLYGDPEPTRYGAWVSNGDGTAEYVEKTFPASRDALSTADVAALYKERSARNTGIAEKQAKARKERLELIESKKLRQGTEWKGAQTYVQGKTGRTTFSRSKITAIDDNGYLTVESVLPGSARTYKFTVDANSRLFDNYPTIDTLTAPTKEDVLAQQQRAADAAKAEAKAQIGRAHV